MANADHWLSESTIIRSGELRSISPKFAEGLARIREVTDADGACPAWAKALYMSAAACVKGHVALMHRELDRAVAGGLAYEHARGASIALLISRGEAVYDTFARAVDAAYGHDLRTGPEVDGELGGATVADARVYFARYFGAVPGYIETMAARAPRALEGYYLMREASLEENPLPWKHVELLLMTVNAGELNDRFVRIHALGARQAGATEDEVIESIVCAIPVAGVAAWLSGAQGIEPREGA